MPPSADPSSVMQMQSEVERRPSLRLNEHVETSAKIASTTLSKTRGRTSIHIYTHNVHKLGSPDFSKPGPVPDLSSSRSFDPPTSQILDRYGTGPGPVQVENLGSSHFSDPGPVPERSRFSEVREAWLP